MSLNNTHNHFRSVCALFLSVLVCLVFASPQIAYADSAITDMDESDYAMLGLTTNEDMPDMVPPYPVDKATDFLVHNEVYLAANGAHGNYYYLRDELNNLVGPGSEDHVEDDYGSIRGAYMFYQDINKFDDGNVDEYDNGGGTYSYLSDNRGSNVLSKGKNEFSGMYAKSVAFKNDAGDNARDTSIAEVRAYGSTRESFIGSNWAYGGIEIVLMDLGENGSRTKRGGSLTPTLNENQVYNGFFKYLVAGYLQEIEASFDLVAADVDGDGADELVCYTGAYEDVSGDRYAIVNLFRHNGGSSSWNAYEVKIYAGKASDYSTATYDHKDEKSWHQLQSVPVVTLAAGDLDRDGNDEVAITCSAPFGKLEASTARCEIYSWRDFELKRIEGIEGAEDGYIPLYATGRTDRAMVSANCAMGTFAEYDSTGGRTGRSVSGLIIAGYETYDYRYVYSKSNRFTRAGYRYVYYDRAEGNLVVSDYMSTPLEKDGKRIVETAAEDSGDKYRYPCTLAPIALACANLKGLASSDARNDAVLLAGDIYQHFACTTHAGSVNGIGPCTGHLSICNKHYNQSNTISSKDTEQVWIGDVETGCVSGDDSFNESFLAVVGIHRDDGCGESDDYYWMDVSHATITDGKLVTGQEGVICESNRRGKTYGTFISLCLPNVLKNGVRARFVTREKVYTDPKVLAVLQETPYYSELQDAFRYRSMGSTGFGSGSSSGSSNGCSLNGSLGGYIDIEAGFLAGGQLAAELALAPSYDYENSTSLSSTVSYASGTAEGNQVVVCTLPMIYYCYEVTNEATGETGPMILTSSLGVQNSVVPMSVYDQIAKKCKMTPISTYLTNRSGDPETYESVLNVDDAVRDSLGLGNDGVERAYTADSWVEASESNGSNSTMLIDDTHGKDHTLGVGFTVNAHVGGGFKLFGDKAIAGVVFNFYAGYNHVWSSSDSTIFSGTVDNLPKSMWDSYGFSWRLAVDKLDRKTVDPNNEVDDKDLDDVWIVGYDLKNVRKADAPAVTGFAVSGVDDHSVELRWDDVLEAGSGLSYGIGMLGNGGSEVTSYRVVDPGAKSYVWDDLLPNTTYSFVIASVVDTGGDVDPKGIRSATVQAMTLPKGMTFTVVGPAANPKNPENHESLSSDSSVLLSEGDGLTLACFGSVTRVEEVAGTQGTSVNERGGSDDTGLVREAFASEEEFDEGPVLGTEGLGSGQAVTEPVAKIPDYIWFKKARGESEWKRENTYPVSSVEETSVLDLGTMDEGDDGTQYYCRVGYSNYSVDTTTITVGVTSDKEEGKLYHSVKSSSLPSERLSELRGGQAFLQRMGYHIEIIEEDPDDAEPEEETNPDKTPDQGRQDNNAVMRPNGYGPLGYGPLYDRVVGYPFDPVNRVGTAFGSGRQYASTPTSGVAGTGGFGLGVTPRVSDGVFVQDPMGVSGSPTAGTGGSQVPGATVVTGSAQVPTTGAVPVAKQPLSTTGDRTPVVSAVLALGLVSICLGGLAARRRRDRS